MRHYCREKLTVDFVRKDGLNGLIVGGRSGGLSVAPLGGPAHHRQTAREPSQARDTVEKLGAGVRLVLTNLECVRRRARVRECRGGSAKRCGPRARRTC